MAGLDSLHKHESSSRSFKGTRLSVTTTTSKENNHRLQWLKHTMGKKSLLMCVYKHGYGVCEKKGEKTSHVMQSNFDFKE